jgi:2-polyprenyl-6-methoxyphenol hydroxylase-like FAD-dependent oxidoreductase
MAAIDDILPAALVCNTTDPQATNMRVIIVGAGPAGLVLAHMLPLAGIDDFVVLEGRADVCEPSGAGVGLWPHCVRVLDQLGNGLLDEARQLVPRTRRSLRLGSKGELILANNLFEQIEEK